MTESFTTTVEPGELAARLQDPRWVVVDCRHELNDPSAGREAYRRGHIPGARFVSVDEDLSGEGGPAALEDNLHRFSELEELPTLPKFRHIRRKSRIVR